MSGLYIGREVSRSESREQPSTASQPADLPTYVELHCHSAFSFLDGASHPEQLILEAKALGYQAIALTDHNGLYGSMAFAQAAKSSELQAITGVEITLLDGCHLTVLAETQQGYANLCRLITEAHLGQEDRKNPRVDLVSLERRNEGLIVLSGCRQGLLPKVLCQKGFTKARELTHHLVEVFGSGNFFVELQRNSVRGDKYLTRTLCDIADEVGVDVVATGNVHYHSKSRHHLQDVLVAIRTRTTLDGSHAERRPNGEFHLRAPGAMAELFRDRPDAIANTVIISRRCGSFDITRDLGYVFPDFNGSHSRTAAEALAEMSWEKLEQLYPINSQYRKEAEERVREELRLIEHHNLSGFFLVYRDLLELADDIATEVRANTRRAFSNLLPGRGRGSSVSSIICYFLGLSHIDPIASNLSLGRFLNESLASVPDIDLDFAREIRKELIAQVYHRYGHEHVGLVCTFPTYRLKSAVREVGKVLDLPIGELEQIIKLVDRSSGSTLHEELKLIPGFAEKADSPLWLHLCDIAEEIAGLPRHISQHVGGMIISSKPLLEIVPFELSAMPDRVLVQWDKDSCDDARFVKIDFLALGMLSLLEETVELIAQKEGTAPDLSRIDFEDPRVYDTICSGDTVGLFQIESRGQIQMLRRNRPRNLRDLAIEVAIVRPGPIVGGAVNPYIRRREDQRRAAKEGRNYAPPMPHPLLQEALSETLGVILFQDQVLQVCEALAGFTTGQAEDLRRAMSRRRSLELMESFWEEFRDGALRRGVPESTAKSVFKQVVAFAAFGFPKSHAVAFGLLAYQSAWLRFYYPLEYYVGLFNNQPMGFYSIDTLCRDAARHGVSVKLPHFNRSDVYCTVEDDAIRVGLGFIRGWSWRVAKELVIEREARGPFHGIADLVRRSPPALSRDSIENLIWVGGCDDLELNRREMIWQVGLFLPPKTEKSAHLHRRQLELPIGNPYGRIPFRAIGKEDKLLAEYDVLGFATSGHPLMLLRENLPGDIVRNDELGSLDHGSRVRVSGLVVARQRPQTAKGILFILMEDETGMVNVIVSPTVYDECRHAIRGEPFLLVEGKLAKDDGALNIIASNVVPLAVKSGASRVPLAPNRNPRSFLKKLRGSAPTSRSWH